jgi:DNA-binding response OmpR family regulator
MGDKLPILLCEDNEEIIMITVYFLKSKNFEVSVARTSEEGIKFLSANSPSLLLLDLNLPTKGGEYILQKIKSERNNIPVILFSGDNRVEKIAAELGADGYLKKPFDLDRMISVIDSVTKLSMPS